MEPWIAIAYAKEIEETTNVSGYFLLSFRKSQTFLVVKDDRSQWKTTRMNTLRLGKDRSNYGSRSHKANDRRANSTRQCHHSMPSSRQAYNHRKKVKKNKFELLARIEMPPWKQRRPSEKSWTTSQGLKNRHATQFLLESSPTPHPRSVEMTSLKLQCTMKFRTVTLRFCLSF